MSSAREENVLWLIVQIKSATGTKGRLLELVSNKDLINAPSSLHTGKSVSLKSGLSTRRVKIVHVSDDKKFLETQLRNLREESKLVDQAKQDNLLEDDGSNDSHAGDFSYSGSEWDPEEHTSSESEDEFIQGQRRHSSNGSCNKKLSFDIKGPIVDGAYHQNIGLTIKMLTEYLGNTVGNKRPDKCMENNNKGTNENDCPSSTESKITALHEALQNQLNAFVHEEENLATTSDKHTQTVDSGDVITRAMELANIFKLSEDILEVLQMRKNNLQEQINETYRQLVTLKKRLKQTANTFPNASKGSMKVMSEKLKDIKIRKHERKLNRAMLKSNIKIIRNELISVESLFSGTKNIPSCNNISIEESNERDTQELENQTNNNYSIGQGSKYDPPPNVATVNTTEPPIVTDPYSIETEFPSLTQETNAVSTKVSIDNGNKSKTSYQTSSEHVSSSNRTSSEIINSTNDQGMIPIGTGRTLINSYEYAQLNWNSHTMATRKLLLAVFSRKELATHSLTGKPSPAFANKPTKLQLDPVKINDIIIEVSKGCRVQPRYVRSAITTKCADENKMRKIRMRKGKRKRKAESEESADNRDMESQENVNPQIQS